MQKLELFQSSFSAKDISIPIEVVKICVKITVFFLTDMLAFKLYFPKWGWPVLTIAIEVVKKFYKEDT